MIESISTAAFVVLVACGSKTPTPPPRPADASAVVDPLPPVDATPATPTPTPTKPDVAADCKRFEADRHWVSLLDCGKRLATTDAAGGRAFVDLAISEARAEIAMRNLKTAAKAHDVTAAKQAHAEIPPTSVYRAEADATLADLAPGAQLGADCSKSQACAGPATCVSYRGIAGARGPEFKTCEIKCVDSKSCPNGTQCMTIADGPGRVCR